MKEPVDKQRSDRVRQAIYCFAAFACLVVVCTLVSVFCGCLGAAAINYFWAWLGR
jgi:hypothetical protein